MIDHSAGATSAGHVGELLSDYLNQSLDEADRQNVEAHLRECTRCSADLRALRITVAAVRRLPPAPVPRSFAISAGAVSASTGSGAPVTSFLTWSTRSLAAALVLFLAVGAIRPIIAPDSAGSPLFGTRTTTVPAVGPLTPQPADGIASENAQRAARAQQAASANATQIAIIVESSPRPAAAAAAPTSTPAPAAAAAPAAPVNPAAAAVPQKSATSNGIAASRPLAAAGTAATPAYTSYPGPEAQNAIPNPATGSYPAADTATTYPGAVAPAAVATPVASSYPGQEVPAVAPPRLPSQGYPYPSEGSPGGAVVPAAANQAPSATVSTHPVSNGQTTWFTPALVLLLLLAVVSAVAMSWLSRRGR